MTKVLDVYLHRYLVGKLIQNEYGHMVFEYLSSWLAHPNAIPLSRSLPLQAGQFSRKIVRGFFEGILPEANQRRLIAKNLGISAQNDFAMLYAIGGECAGAVTFLPEGIPLSEVSPKYRTLNESQLAKILSQLTTHPLLAGSGEVRLSLAGAQGKLAVLFEEGKIALPLNGAASSHILKPDNPAFEGLLNNEAFCMTLAKAIGLPVAPVTLHQADEINYLLISRYDRVNLKTSGMTTENKLHRLHQEDFCQALGVVSEMKYQNEGGPSLQDIFSLLRNISYVPAKDLKYLLDAVIFNLFIGNYDAHGKNFSLLHEQCITESNGSERIVARTRLAPLYDLVCTVYYPQLTQKMAMKIGSEYQANRLQLRHIEKFSNLAGLSFASVLKRMTGLAESILSTLPTLVYDDVYVNTIKKLITQRCQTWLDKL